MRRIRTRLCLPLLRPDYAAQSCRHSASAACRCNFNCSLFINCRWWLEWFDSVEWIDENFCKLRSSLNLLIARSRLRNGKWEFSTLLFSHLPVSCFELWKHKPSEPHLHDQRHARHNVPLPNFYEHLIHMPTPVGVIRNWLNPLLSDLASEQRRKLVPPIAVSFIADIDTAFMQQIFDVPQWKRKPNIHHDRKSNDLRRSFEVAKRVLIYHP